ncbi:MAG: helix-turn-helix domain-containing protein [Candidatus Competibacteraceae bacterium]|nr:helix-turn-helix domain-containing protein [Candidatus Competibacteraceae bacterium]
MTALKKQDFVQDGSNIDGIDQLFETDTLTDCDPEIVLDCLTTTPTTNRDQSDLTPEQAALALGKSVRTIRRMLEKGSLPGYKIAGKNAMSGEWL